MSSDGIPDESTDDQSENDSLEQRIRSLEEQVISVKEGNKDLKTALERQQESGLPNVTRRQALGGLLGGGALLGAAGSASAQPPSGPGGPPFADDDHDHSGDFLGEGEPVDRIDVTDLNVESLSGGDGDAPFADEDHDHSSDYLGEGEPVSRIDVNDAHVGEIYNMNGSDEVIQTAWDGMVVPVAPGLGASDAIDPTATTTPVQDAVDAIDAAAEPRLNAHSGGGVLLPPTTITRRGPPVTGLGNKVVRGWGFSSVVNVERDGDSFINCAGRPENGMRTYLTDFCIDGGLSPGRDPDGRTGGSAIEATDTNARAGRGFNIGRLLFTRWYGQDPVINFTANQPYSSYWQWLRAEDYAGSFIHSSDGWFDINIDTLFAYARPGARNHPVVNITKLGGPSHIQSMNVGGEVRRGLYVDQNDPSEHTSLTVGDINLEPGLATGGALDSSVAPAPIEIYGSRHVRIGRVTIDRRLESDYSVALGGTVRHGDASSGPGNAIIGPIAHNTARNNYIAVLDAPDSESWYWGSADDIDYGSHPTKAVIPMADLRP